MKNLVVDWFSGTGSATDAFRECGRHTVVHVDIRSPAELRCDVRRAPRFLLRERAQFAWASPPCTEFSQLTFLRQFQPGGEPPDPEAGMELVRLAFSFASRAEHWAVENVRRSEQFISREFGPPLVRKDAWCIWSNVDNLLFAESNAWRKGIAARFKPGGKWNPGAGDRHKTNRAVVPYAIGRAFHDAICGEYQFGALGKLAERLTPKPPAAPAPLTDPAGAGYQ